MSAHRTTLALTLACLGLAACDDAPTALGNLVVLPGGSALVFQGGATTAAERTRIEDIVAATTDAARDEFHHIARFRAEGPSETLFEAIVTEGLADRFTLELLAGDPPIWATAVQGAELVAWIETASETWMEPEFDPGPWFFAGFDSEVPQWTGYSIGWELTGRYLAANPSQNASTLVGTPASAFLPE